jgi:hypothetical protein
VETIAWQGGDPLPVSFATVSPSTSRMDRKRCVSLSATQGDGGDAVGGRRSHGRRLDRHGLRSTDERAMKTMICRDLGGPCDCAYRGDTADVVIKSQDTHLRDVVAGGDRTHDEAFKAMEAPDFGNGVAITRRSDASPISPTTDQSDSTVRAFPIRLWFPSRWQCGGTTRFPGQGVTRALDGVPPWRTPAVPVAPHGGGRDGVDSD